MKTSVATLLLLIPLALTGCGGGASAPAYSGEPANSPALPATEVANAAPDGPLSRREAWRLLDQGTFGPQLDDVERLAASGPEAWINEQMSLPATFLLPVLERSRYDRWNEYVNAWFRNAIQAEDQLRQRVAFALSQILVVSGRNGLAQEQRGLANYYDILMRHAFGNYRDLLEDVTLSPVMGEYLSMKGNRKPDLDENIRPDENYARELLQLFSIGLVMLNPDGTPVLDEQGRTVPSYTQETVEAFAHVFTGWHFANAEDFRWPQNKDYMNPMEAWADYHDTGSKTLLDGRVLPAGQSARQDLADALDNVFNHPNVAPFVSRQLIQRLVTSNPSPEYVRDVAAVFERNAAGERGNLGSTVKAILMHREARSGHLASPETFGKLREPLLRLTQLWRAFEPGTIPRDFSYAWVDSDLSQSPLNAASVFNYYRPDFSQPGEILDNGLVAPEFEIHDETSMLRITGRLLAASIWSHNQRNDFSADQLLIDISEEMQLEENRDALIEHLDDLLLGGRMSDALRREVETIMDARDYESGKAQRIVEAIYLIMSSPEAAIQI